MPVAEWRRWEVTAVRARIKGIAKVKKTLANGKTIYYCYAWRGGPLLKNEDGSPIQPGDPAFVSAYAEAVELSRNPISNDMKMLVREFRASSDFRRKSKSTLTEYNRYLDEIVRTFGFLSLGELERKETRGKFKEWRDAMADTPRKADYAWTTLARVLSFAKDRGRLSVNICERGGRLYHADRNEKLWTSKDIDAFNASVGPEMRLALTIALWTGQRQGDLLRLPWRSYDGKTIKVKQSKTGTRVVIPVGASLKAVLDAELRRATTILANTRGHPWTAAGFQTMWAKACSKAGVHGRTFHDLRGTAVTRLALAGCSAAEIGSLTGHSLRDVDAILDAHYLGGKLELAEQAIRKLEAYEADQVEEPSDP